jgi:hypothetical protein
MKKQKPISNSGNKTPTLRPPWLRPSLRDTFALHPCSAKRNNESGFTRQLIATSNKINNEPRETLRATRQPMNDLPSLDGLFKCQKRRGLLVGDVWHDQPRRLAIRCRRCYRPRVRIYLRDVRMRAMALCIQIIFITECAL